MDIISPQITPCQEEYASLLHLSCHYSYDRWGKPFDGIELEGSSMDAKYRLHYWIIVNPGIRSSPRCWESRPDDAHRVFFIGKSHLVDTVTSGALCDRKQRKLRLHVSASNSFIFTVQSEEDERNSRGCATPGCREMAELILTRWFPKCFLHAKVFSNSFTNVYLAQTSTHPPSLPPPKKNGRSKERQIPQGIRQFVFLLDGTLCVTFKSFLVDFMMGGVSAVRISTTRLQFNTHRTFCRPYRRPVLHP